MESIAVFAKDVSDQRRNSDLDKIFQQLEQALLKWSMDLESLAQMFCDRVLPVFDLTVAWIGRAEETGLLTVISASESKRLGLIDLLSGNYLRWDDTAPLRALPTGMVIQNGQQQLVRLSDVDCPVKKASEAEVAIILPITLQRRTWGLLVLYAHEASQFEGLQNSQMLGSIARHLGSVFEASLSHG